MAGRRTNAQAAALRELDYQQVQNVLSGNTAQWEPLCKRAYRTVVRCAAGADQFRLLGRSDYLDAAASAFTLCFEQLDRYRGYSRFSYWVGGYARNIVRNCCRRELVRIRKQELLRNQAAASRSCWNPERIVIRMERDMCLWQAYFELPVLERKIVCALLFENMPPKAAAQRARLSRKEILQRYETALRLLRMRFIRYYG